MKEFVLLEEPASETQKKIRQWMSTGYEIEIVAQTAVFHPNTGNGMKPTVITSLFRTKK